MSSDFDGTAAYREEPPRPPRRQERHTPKPLPFARINAHRSFRRANSDALRVAGVKAVSVTAYVTGVVGAAWMAANHS